MVQRQLATLPHGLREMQQVGLPTACLSPVASGLPGAVPWQAVGRDVKGSRFELLAVSLLLCTLCTQPALHLHSLPPPGVAALPAA